MKTRQTRKILVLLILLHTTGFPSTIFGQNAFSPIRISEEGKLIFGEDDKGDRVPDFSYSGYKGSEAAIPNVPVKVIVPPQTADATASIQKAIDYVSSLPLDLSGFRGAILLQNGNYKVNGSLLMMASGVVLRGSGSDENGTTIIGTGPDRETVVRIFGRSDRQTMDTTLLSDKYFPVNSTEFTFDSEHNFKVGDHVIINRPSTEEWIQSIGADKIGNYVNYHLTHWTPGDFDLNWDRKVTAVTRNSITVDVPITNSIDPQFGSGKVLKYSWNGRIKNVGIENIRFVSTFDPTNMKDENHRWMAITMDNVMDAWARRIVAKNFVSSAVAVWETAKRVTVEDCKSLEPIGEIGNFRRYSFHTMGQQVLFQRCYAEYGYHAFSTGFTTSGPNAFVQCYSNMPHQMSGAIGGWSNGLLFDNVTVNGGNLSYAYRDVNSQGAGWAAANSLFWNCTAANLYLDKPPSAQNWAYGSWAQGHGDGHHELPHSFLRPESIFYAQLKERTSVQSIEVDKILTHTTSRTSAPSPEYAAEMSLRSKAPDLTMEQWIDQMIEKHPLKNDLSGAKMLSDVKFQNQVKEKKKTPHISIKNGLVLKGNALLSGTLNRTSLWRGATRPSFSNNPRPNLVRFVPGRIGRGLTDDLDSLISDMLKRNIFGMENFPSLWYERRRDDHARTMRADADVWAPFYEQPFSRSGQGEAFDRLSKYDLTKWNSWYWIRLQEYADLADQNGLLFVQDHYCQHNIIEEGAHWTDYPWRSANNINDLGFAEPVAYAGNKRVYMADEFYDIKHPIRKEFHRNYIRKNLSSFKGNINIIHHLGYEYTGPLHFVEFWLDVINEWEKENNTDVLVMLPGTKDVQDAIIADPVRSNTVDIVNVLQWHYKTDGSLYAPKGGVSLAARQYARIMDEGESTADEVYRAVRGFREKYPEKAIVYSRRGGPESNWAGFMAGASFVALPNVDNKMFYLAASSMKPIDMKNTNAKQWAIGQKGNGYIIYSNNRNVTIDLFQDKSNYVIRWINPQSGKITESKEKVKGGTVTELKNVTESASVVWLAKK